MQTILTAYGVNYPETMERFVHSEDLYMECLEMLLNDESLDHLQTSLAQNNLPSAFEAAHTLKGVAANMGLAPLTEAVSALVEPLRKNEQKDYTPDLQNLQSEFNKIETLRQTLQSHRTGGPK